MKIKTLKAGLIKEAIIVAVALGVAGGVCFFSISHTDSVQEEAQKVSQQLSSMRADAQNKQKAYEDILAAMEQYKHIPETRLPSNDYDTIQSRIRTVRSVMGPLEKKYRFSSLDVQLTKIETDPKVKEKDLSVIVSDVNIQFQGVTDEAVDSFAQEFVDQLPGYASIKSLKMDRLQEITPALIAQMKAGGRAVALVTGTVTLVWKTVKDNSQPAPAATPASDTKAAPAPAGGGAHGT